MSTKPIRIKNKQALFKQLPKKYAGKACIIGDGPFALVSFGDDVVHSSSVEKSIRKIPNGCVLVIVARNLTNEAYELLCEFGGQAITLSDYSWTDESHENIKVTIGSNVKRPN